MTDRDAPPRRASDTGHRDSASVTNNDGPADTRAPVDAAADRQLAPAARVRLAAVSVVIILVGAGAGYLCSLLLPPKYAARAEIVYGISHRAQPNDFLREDRKLTTQVVLLHSRAVLGKTAYENSMTPEDLAKNVSARVVENSEIIEVEVRSRTRARAQMLLVAVIAEYLAIANKDWRNPVHTYLESQLNEVPDQLAVPGLTADDVAGLVQRDRVLRDLLDRVEPDPSTGAESPAGPPARVLTEPYSVAAQVSPKPPLAAAAGAATAAVVAAFVVLLVVRRKNPIVS